MTINLDHTYPYETTPAPCRLCRHYLGQTYGGNYLNCGIHTYGPSGPDCEDMEPLSPTTPRTSRMLPHQPPRGRDPQVDPASYAMPRDGVSMFQRVIDQLLALPRMTP